MRQVGELDLLEGVDAIVRVSLDLVDRGEGPLAQRLDDMEVVHCLLDF